MSNKTYPSQEQNSLHIVYITDRLPDIVTVLHVTGQALSANRRTNQLLNVDIKTYVHLIHGKNKLKIQLM